jgi:MoxR-like ATPase
LPADVTDLATDVLSHRLVLTYEALADGVAAPSIVERVLQVVAAPQIAPSQLQDVPA